MFGHENLFVCILNIIYTKHVSTKISDTTEIMTKHDNIVSTFKSQAQNGVLNPIIALFCIFHEIYINNTIRKNVFYVGKDNKYIFNV